MNELQNFNFNGNQLRTVLIDNEPFFVGKDAAAAIGYSNTRKAIRDHVKGKYLREERIVTPSGVQTVTVISEPGLYQLAGESKLPSAEPFQDWVYEEVLPTIRKHGAYMTDAKAQDVISGNGLADLLLQAGNQIKQLELEKSQMKPKALFADSVSASENTILIRDLAKILKQNGIDIGEKRLFTWLRDNGYLVKKIGSDYNSPTQRSMNLGILEFTENTHVHNSGKITVTKTPKVTGKGQIYFVNKFLQDLAS
ncbi:phage antirepressor KilAC domain-containing protein [Lactococcus lactis]|uniref:Phage repressor protein/antirepressor Ant n=1 Tax=Lactococcus lactis TaxID=1358 RepID=A0A552Z2I4_9LACT|nr:phage antirepressor KilAC domain-containing protein [Lactococcus lactis]MCT3098210.1 phage repressor protein/antirepressor Ant [Lactococcus lactis]MDA2886604.1 phage antirepressor KilAC domain-containing protein [Lactococcus lactis]MDA2889108.1 phage antirepressor KilAC domain-containing protein [Lactococcus lactis]MDA2907939.1 phage antirepressor KilAC domain-containing protein [Lactococcus lactis]TRW73720.1 phage repressor protein/antirepressor Ant [Lactococcus lactis]